MKEGHSDESNHKSRPKESVASQSIEGWTDDPRKKPTRGRKHPVRAASWPDFYDKLAFMISAGMPVVAAQEQSEINNDDIGLGRHLKGVIHDLNKGIPLPIAFRNNFSNLPAFHFELLQLAMETGKLEEVLRCLANYEGANLTARLKLRAALAYPAFQFGMALLLLSIAPAHFRRGFVETLAFMDRGLPLPVDLFFKFSIFMNYLGVTLLIVVSVLIIPPVKERVRNFWHGDTVRALLAHMRVKAFRVSAYIPGLRTAVSTYSQEKFVRALALQLQAGRALVPSLKAAFKITSDPNFIDHASSVVDAIANGQNLEEALAATDLFDKVMVLSFVSAGEESGTLADLLLKSADIQAGNLEVSLGRAVTLLNPILLFIVGGFVCTLVMMVFVPLLQLTQSL